MHRMIRELPALLALAGGTLKRRVVTFRRGPGGDRPSRSGAVLERRRRWSRPPEIDTYRETPPRIRLR
jgi:hypothetical protein